MCGNRAYYKNHHRAARKARRRAGKAFWMDKFNSAFNHPPVNVQEMDDRFILHLYAAGYEKEDFQISTIDGTITISARKEGLGESQWKRQEYDVKSFERKFELVDTIDKDAISAQYENGVLIITLPKLAGAETNRSEILIS